MRIINTGGRACARAAATVLLTVGAGILAAAPADAIVGGQPASTKAYPWAVALSTPLVPFSFCGGALLTPTKVLTAAHCVTTFQDLPGLLHVVAGRDRILSSSGTDVTVRSIWIDPGYATFTFMCGNMACSASWSISVLNLCLSLSAIAFAAAGRALISSVRRLRFGNFSQPFSPSTFGMRRAQPHTFMSTIV